MTTGNRLFCSRPFEWLEIASNNEGAIERPVASLCCPGWLKDPYIPFTTSALAEAWNHPKAQALRASVLDGSFRLCRKDECPYLGQGQTQGLFGEPSPVQPAAAVDDPRLREIIDEYRTVLADGPKVLNCGYDRTCNLACPSCRSELIGRNREEVGSILRFQEQLFSEVRGSLVRLYVTGSGDPFASEAFRRLLGRIDPAQHPQLEVHLHTNGILFTPERWSELGPVNRSVTSVEISVDAASESTYRINRGGRWDVLLENFEFVAQLRRAGPIRFVALSFVVQENNFHELPAFVELARRHGFDGVRFAGIRNWGTFTPEEFKRRDVADPAHPRHGELLEVLRRAELDDPGVVLGDLFPLRPSLVFSNARSGPGARP